MNRVDRVSHVTAMRRLECCSIFRQHRSHDRDRRGAHAFRHVSALERGDHPATTPAIRHRHEPPRELRDVLDLERELAEWITGEAIEARGNHYETGSEVACRIR